MPATSSAPLASALKTRLIDGVLGRDPKCALALVNWILIAQAAIVGLTLLALTGDQGPLSSPQVAFLYLYCITGIVGFYAVIRAGFTAGFKDPGLTILQAWFYVLAIAIAFFVSPIARSVCLELLLVLAVFYMRRLTRSQIRALTWGAAILMVLALLVLRLQQGLQFDTPTEVLNVAMVAVMLPILSAAALDMQRLRRARIMQYREITKVQKQLQELVTVDAQTSLFNRRHMLSLLEEEGKRQARSEQALCVAVIDLDHFKRVNEHFGNPIGDAVLRSFAGVLSQVLRNTDIASRWSGQQFLILMPNTDTDQAMQAMERLRYSVAHHNWTVLAPDLKISFTAGVCQHRRGGDVTLTVERAILALQAGKAAGYGRALAAKEPK